MPISQPVSATVGSSACTRPAATMHRWLCAGARTQWWFHLGAPPSLHRASVSVRVVRRGASCCSMCTPAASRPLPRWRPATALWASGPRWPRSFPRRARSGAGCTRRRTCSTSCRRACNRRRPRRCTRSGWPRRDGAPGVSPVRRRVRRQVPRRGRLSREGPQGAPDVLRLPGGALAASAHQQPDRVHLRLGAAAYGEDPRVGQSHGVFDDGLQPAGATAVENLERRGVAEDVINGETFEDGIRKQAA